MRGNSQDKGISTYLYW